VRIFLHGVGGARTKVAACEECRTRGRDWPALGKFKGRDLCAEHAGLCPPPTPTPSAAPAKAPRLPVTAPRPPARTIPKLGAGAGVAARRALRACLLRVGAFTEKHVDQAVAAIAAREARERQTPRMRTT